MSINLTNTMVCWKDDTGEVKLVSHPDTTHASRGWSTWGACDFHIKQADPEARKAQLFITAMHLIIRDHIDPLALHLVLLELEEYQDGCSPDMPGAH